MDGAAPSADELPQLTENGVKVICIGDSAVGKSKFVLKLIFIERSLFGDIQAS